MWVNCQPQFIHAALWRLGHTGETCELRSGLSAGQRPVVDVWVLWEDAAGKKHRVRRRNGSRK